MLSQYYPTVSHGRKYELNKDLHFSAAHYIDSPTAGKCREVHGHTYFVNITIIGDELDPTTGFLVDFRAIKEIVKQFDHTLINDSPYFDEHRQPSTENLAETIWEAVETYLITLGRDVYCAQVILRETPTSYVRYVNQYI